MIPGGALKVLAVTGASGGHIFPALSFLEALSQRYPQAQIRLILPRKHSAGNIGFKRKIHYTCVISFRSGSVLRNLVAVYRFVQGCLESVFVLLEFQPDIVVGFGTMASLPVLVIAWFFRMKVMIHEQNVTLGKANAALLRFADAIALSFEETGSSFKRYAGKVFVTGNPIRKQLAVLDKEEALKGFGLSPGSRPLALVMGGSQGSHKVNTEFVNALKALPEKKRPQVIHLCGRIDIDFLRESYKVLSIESRCFVFYEDMQCAYSAADFAICRAGASTLAEIIFFGLPVILLPYPYAGSHQLNNARLLEKRGAALLIQDDDLNPKSLSGAMVKIMDDAPSFRQAYGHNHDRRKSSADALVDAVLSLN